jgi:hypothetical protein
MAWVRSRCERGQWDERFVTDAVEDLMSWHAKQCIDRLERLAEECPAALETIAYAYVGGIASSPALERFWKLQERPIGHLQG